MATAAIVLDDFKLERFVKALKEHGYEYEQHPGVTKDTVTLKVTTDSMLKLGRLVKKLNTKV